MKRGTSKISTYNHLQKNNHHRISAKTCTAVSATVNDILHDRDDEDSERDIIQFEKIQTYKYYYPSYNVDVICKKYTK